MKKTVITATSDTTKMAALGTEGAAAVIANASPYKFQFHGETGHTVVYALAGSGMTQQTIPTTGFAMTMDGAKAKGMAAALEAAPEVARQVAAEFTEN